MTGVIQNFREVNYRALNINFASLFNRQYASEIPHEFMSTVKFEKEKVINLSDLLRELPTITYIKLSEFSIKGEEWNFYENARIILELIDLFSPKRCMFASNFPVSKLKITFDNLFNNYKKIVEN